MTRTIDSHAFSDLLDRHQRRREQAIPTVSVLSGPVGLGVRRWRAWAARRGFAVVALSVTDVREIVSAWLRSLAAARDLAADAVAWLARVTGQDPDEVRRAAGLTGNDFEWFWRGLPIPSDLVGPAAVCRLILGETGDQASPNRTAARVLGAITAGLIPVDLQVVASLAAIVPGAVLPTVLLTPPEADSAALWLSEAACLLAGLAASVPSLAVALAAEVPAVEALSRTGAPGHTLAVLREGFVPVESLGEADVVERLRAAGVAPTPVAAARRMAKDGASEELALAFAEAARRTGRSATPEEEDAARSAAERFLFERLETLPTTAGLFAPNQRLDFRHGPAPAEADLFAASLRLVIELDGSYFHLRDPAAYRRDRRKDWELQRRGYLVLRFLSEDVVERLEEILDTILAAVELRRSLTTDRGRPV
jgi:hypothetical protein